MRITYYDGDTGAQLKQFFLSDVIGHDLEENEVYQINNIFNDSAIPSTVHTLVIHVEAQCRQEHLRFRLHRAARQHDERRLVLLPFEE